METFKVIPREKICASLTVPPDKSITHRAIILSCLSDGKSVIHNYLNADDTKRTINAFEILGIKMQKFDDKIIIEGNGIDGLKKPSEPINAGNSGTTMRLLAGVLSGQNFNSEIYGDESLSKRPMRRIIEPLRMMNVEIIAKDDNFPPLKIKPTFLFLNVSLYFITAPKVILADGSTIIFIRSQINFIASIV